MIADVVRRSEPCIHAYDLLSTRQDERRASAPCTELNDEALRVSLLGEPLGLVVIQPPVNFQDSAS